MPDPHTETQPIADASKFNASTINSVYIFTALNTSANNSGCFQIYEDFIQEYAESS